MARCPTCESEITHVSAEIIDLEGTQKLEGDMSQSGQAVATVCPKCEAIIGI